MTATRTSPETPLASAGRSGRGDASPGRLPLPAIVRGEVRHERFHPIRHRFSYRVHQWLVDVDDPHVAPRGLRALASFKASDHVGGSAGPWAKQGSLGENVRAFVAAQGVAWTCHRVIMLANARVLGYVFDPLTVFWCYAEDGTLEGVLAEVHNTYGERHAYLVELSDRGTATVDKQLYVSPFFGVFGDYQLRFRLGDHHAGVRGGPDPSADGAEGASRSGAAASVGVFVTLRQDGRVMFTGSFTGAARPVTARRLLGVAFTQPLMPYRVSALIRWHGIRLWLRRLPVVRRLPHREQPGAH